jgi:hypothetical protein
VPVAISVTTAETLDRAKIRDIKDLASMVPFAREGVNRAPTPPSSSVVSAMAITMRVWNPAWASLSMASIVAQRGPDRRFPRCGAGRCAARPQSTLFGKNASAGVVAITTAEPQMTTHGSAEVSYGNYNAVVVAARTGKPPGSGAVDLAGGYNRATGPSRMRARG